MKKLFACLLFVVVCMAVVPVLAQEAPAAPAGSTPVVVEKGGILIQNKSPINVEVNVPEAEPPVVENNMEFPDEIAVTRADRGFCERNPMTCVLGGVAIVAAGCLAADQLGAFDSTNSVEFQK